MVLDLFSLTKTFCYGIFQVYPSAWGMDSCWRSWWKLSPMGGTPHGRRWRVWGVSLLRRKEWQRQCEMSWLQPPIPLLFHWEGGGRENQSEVELGKKGGVVGGVFKIWVCFSLSYFGLIGKKFCLFLQFNSEICLLL